MSKQGSGTMTVVIRVIFLVLIALLMLTPGVGAFVLIVFVPVVGWLIWRDQDRIAELEKKLAASESPAQSKSEEA